MKKSKVNKRFLLIGFLLLSVFLTACSLEDSQSEEEVGPANGHEMEHGDEKADKVDHDDHHEHGAGETELDEEEMRADIEQTAATPPGLLNENATNGLNVTNTKNITRINEDDPVAMSILTSQTVWPATHEENQPGTVILAPLNQWQYSLAALTLVHHPNDGPMLYFDGEISDNVVTELNRLQPKGNNEGVQILVVGDLPKEEINKLDEYNVEQIHGINAADFAQKIEEKFSETINDVHPNVIIGSSEEDAKGYTISVANWIAHMNESLLYVDNEGIPKETVDALNKREDGVTIYIVGPEDIISDEIAQELENYGAVHRIEGANPVAQSIEFAAYKDIETDFGWGITDPGHGFVFSSTSTPDLAIAAAPFAHLGKHAPIIWLEDGEITSELYEYIASVKPAFSKDPTEGPYNHGYVVGTFANISFMTQGILDEKLEIVSLSGDDHGGH
ncbi:cell wall-binding repeat-containing protein [Halalkalibacter kiskunsagensis]|uniref:Cell wall-binding repeat-containing protein n=1 Tax=Halalkalibacter kiskunsagensis TaxID=1548599 RepID=A0ABV6KHL0_9BACI